MSERLTKSMRLRRRREFLAVQGGGSKVSTRHLVALATRRDDRDGPGRVGFTVTKRVGNAVTRNRIKRFGREWLRRHGWVPAGWDVVIIAKDSAAALERSADLGPDLARIQRHLGC